MFCCIFSVTINPAGRYFFGMLNAIAAEEVTNLYNLHDDQTRYKGFQKSILPLGKRVEEESEMSAATKDEDPTDESAEGDVETDTAKSSVEVEPPMMPDRKKGVYIDLFEKAVTLTSSGNADVKCDTEVRVHGLYPCSSFKNDHNNNV